MEKLWTIEDVALFKFLRNGDVTAVTDRARQLEVGQV